MSRIASRAVTSGALGRHAVPTLSLACVTGLVNEWGAVPQRVSSRPWAGYPGAGSAERRLLEEEWAAARDAGPAPDDAAVVAAADAVHPVFAATGPGERARLLDALVSTLGLGPRVEVRDGAGDLALGWAVPRRGARLTAALVVALLPATPRAGAPRLGTCGAQDCADVFADVSPRQDRAYCSVRCQARERARARRSAARGPAVVPAQRVR
ncbi:CGNR zinc finger domain-containing protein [Isoptericola sp. NPDC057391]|uniref:CGNR zinc finger domain-containing protein n=1 Tax=Isoptericola sp. NPDC057391 TaxID=3346117 RepID=UPI00362D065F